MSFSRGRNFFNFFLYLFWNETTRKTMIFIIFSFFPMVFHFLEAVLSVQWPTWSEACSQLVILFLSISSIRLDDGNDPEEMLV